ncbi:chorismate mutase [Candidatus Gracilibacteria bacterium]|nr:chorismate mutase [Candidatus Gracilibacteria bacterium]
MNELQYLRENINSIDTQLLELLGKRFEVVKKVGNWKKENGITQPLDEKRWNELLANNIKVGREKGLSSKFITDIWNRIHEEALKLEK